MASTRPQHHKQPRQVNILYLWFLILLLISIIAIITVHTSLPQSNSFRSPIRYDPEPLVLDAAIHIADEGSFRAIMAACVAKKDDVIFYDRTQKTVVLEREPQKRHCPALDIILLGPDRDHQNCQTASIYAVHASARIIGQSDAITYDATCGTSTARMFLQNVYSNYISSTAGVLHMQWVGGFHQWLQQQEQQEGQRKKIGVFLCSTKRCIREMSEHLRRQRSRAGVWYVGQTAPDLSLTPGRAVPAYQEGKVDKGLFIALEDDEGSRTMAGYLLRCWKSLSVGGTGAAVPLVAVIPPKWRQTQEWGVEGVVTVVPQGTSAVWPLPSKELESYQQNISTHIFLPGPISDSYPSLLDQARSLSVLAVAPAAAPWDELLDESSGALIKPLQQNPGGAVAEGGAALGRKGGHGESGSGRPESSAGGAEAGDGPLSEADVCNGIRGLLKLTPQEVAVRRAAARQRYLQDRGRFLARCQDLARFLARRGSSKNPMGSTWMNAIAAMEAEDPAHPMHTHLLSREFELET